ncbi:E3 ubiquitin ligase [Paraconiothyrium brasiliense]|uniref:E3 ubiquitin ligase n=1 Tax=Paraconiothyrium brasiliense TaxID=300254 RepID=A0ABR3QU90_9PLEO
MNHTRPPSPPLAAARPKNSSSSIASQHAASASSQTLAGSASSKARGTTPSRSPAQAADGRPGRAASKDSLKQKMAAKIAEEPSRPSKADEQLQVLRSEFDSLRSHLTCKICDRLLYQPYTIACGHTYCYSCLCTWFVNNKQRKTCPDCRTVVTHTPAPAYVIRDMITVFINRAELLPSGETRDLHTKWQKEEADAVQLDKDNTDPRVGGLFKGCFKPTHARGPSLQVIRDQEDGVERCPVCSWELEDGECVQCGLFFDDNGELTWTDSFTGFSDMDEMSEQELSGEDLDAEMDMNDPDFDPYGAPPSNWEDYYPDDGNFMMQRFLQHGIPAGYMQQRRPMSHSEAGSRRSYSQSIVSDLLTEEMDTVEEEDEEDMEEDSSMNDFIDDDEDQSSTSAGASSTPGQTPQPSNSQSRPNRRVNRVVESETSSTISSVIEEEEEDEEDQGPIRRGQRNRAQTRILNRANGSREPSGPPSSTSTDVSTDDLDEDTQALLQSQGWMLQHHGPDEMGEDDDSDGGRTTVGSTVGWDATAISNDRVRMGGSLTPTADRPRPNNTIRPPSRVGNPLRRQASVLSTANAHYEDGEADDDDSDMDQDGDITMAINSLRNRRSRAQLRNAAAFANYNNRYSNRGLSQGNRVDVDADDNSDHSQDGLQQTRQQAYNPRISRLFADHQRALQELQGGLLVDLEPRSITPIARPRTSNRNRPSPGQAFSPFMPPAPARMRTPLMNSTANPAFNPRGPTSPPRRTSHAPSLSEVINGDYAANAGRAASVSSASNSSAVLTPGTSTPTSQQSNSTISQAQAGLSIDPGDRPPSRLSRPPSATGRRNSAGFSPVYAQFPHSNVGLNIQGRIFPPQAGNPWGAFVQPRIRNRNSRQVLREQSSTATLRAVNSRANIREPVTTPQGPRAQASRINLRPQASRRQLNSQASTRTLRASEHARPPQSPTTGVASAGAQPASRPTRYTPEETDRLARELINNRMQVLRPPGPAPARNNPFVPGFRRPTNPAEATAGATAPSYHSRSNSNESANSGNSSHTTTMAPSSPGLTRRRSNRHIGTTPPGVIPANPGGAFPTAASGYYARQRQASIGSSNSAFDMPLDANARGLSPMLATSLI